MIKENLSTLIALFGVLLSAGISLLTSRIVSRNETRKMRLEAKKIYASKLLDTRIEVYPALYNSLSHFVKTIRKESIQRHEVESFLATAQEWDSKNAIFLSARTGYMITRLRKSIESLLIGHSNRRDEDPSEDEPLQSMMIRLPTRKMKMDSQAKVYDYSDLEEIVNRIGALELALKSDLGVFGMDNSSDEPDVRFIESYGRIREEYKHEGISPKKRK
jgi:hypothetical protein